MSTSLLRENNSRQFKAIIWEYYQTAGRQFSWRETTNPYHIFISEVMLQQTQTSRVEQKFTPFVTQFDSFSTLAHASLKDILIGWQGLGYNRRARYIQQAARTVLHEYNGTLPNDPKLLVQLPGIGPNTAGSIGAFAFNQPTVFIETNIRAVYIHFFFQHQDTVHDRELIPLIQATCDQNNPREWYYALMDYGVMLKKKYINPSKKSVHHTVQSKFDGSDRQIRGAILRLLSLHEHVSVDELINCVDSTQERVQKIVDNLQQEGFLQISNDQCQIKTD